MKPITFFVGNLNVPGCNVKSWTAFYMGDRLSRCYVMFNPYDARPLPEIDGVTIIELPDNFLGDHKDKLSAMKRIVETPSRLDDMYAACQNARE